MRLERRHAGLALGLAALAALLLGWASGALPGGIDRAAVDAWVARAGPWGPLAVVGLMTVAIVASPISSAPIALAAGALWLPSRSLAPRAARR